MSRTDQQLQIMCRKILQHNYDEKAIRVDLEEFQRLYSIMTTMLNRVPNLSLVKSLGNEVFAQFSDVSPQHFIILHSGSLMPEAFAFVLNKSWYGAQVRSQWFIPFLMTELRSNIGKLSLIFSISAILLFIANSGQLYDLMSTLLIQSGTVFLSIYLIFTVSQSQRLAEDRNLFKMGITHKYYSDDRNVTLLAILTIALTFFNSMLVSILEANNLSVSIGSFVFDSRLWGALSTALVISFLFDSFFVVSNYYLGRTLDVVERDSIADILDKDFQEHHKTQDEGKN